jgi:hypothetical protein
VAFPFGSSVASPWLGHDFEVAIDVRLPLDIEGLAQGFYHFLFYRPVLFLDVYSPDFDLGYRAKGYPLIVLCLSIC